MAKINELRGLIYSRYNSEAQLANELGWTRQRLNNITNGLKMPDLDEVVALSEKLDLPVDDTVQLFLRHKSPFEQPLDV